MIRKKEMIISLKGNETVLSEDRVACILNRLVLMGVTHNDIPSLPVYIRQIEPETEYERYKDECQWYKMRYERDKDLLFSFGEDDFRVFKRSYCGSKVASDGSAILLRKDCNGHKTVSKITSRLKTVPISVQLKNLQPPESLIQMINAQKEKRKERTASKCLMNKLKREVESNMLIGAVRSRLNSIMKDGKRASLSPIHWRSIMSLTDNQKSCKSLRESVVHLYSTGDKCEASDNNSSVCTDHNDKESTFFEKLISFSNITDNIGRNSTLLDGAHCDGAQHTVPITVDIAQNEVSDVHNRKHHRLSCIYHPNSINKQARKVAANIRFPVEEIKKSLARKERAKNGSSSHIDEIDRHSDNLGRSCSASETINTDDPILCFVLPDVVTELPKEVPIPPESLHSVSKCNNSVFRSEDDHSQEMGEIEISAILDDNRDEKSFTDQNIVEIGKQYLSQPTLVETHNVIDRSISTGGSTLETCNNPIDNTLLSASGMKRNQLTDVTYRGISKSVVSSEKISLCDLMRCTTQRMCLSLDTAMEGKGEQSNIVILTGDGGKFPKETKGSHEETQLVPPTHDSGTPTFCETSSQLEISSSVVYTPDISPFLNRPIPAYYRDGPFYDCNCFDGNTSVGSVSSDDQTTDPNTLWRTSKNLTARAESTGIREKRRINRSMNRQHSGESVEAVLSMADCSYSTDSDNQRSTEAADPRRGQNENEGDVETFTSNMAHTALKDLINGFRAVKVQAARCLDSKLVDREEQRRFVCQERRHLHLVALQAQRAGQELATSGQSYRTLCSSTPTNASMWAPLFDVIHGDRQYVVNIQKRYLDFVDYCASVKFPQTQTEQNFIADFRNLCVADTSQRPGSQALMSASVSMGSVKELRSVTSKCSRDSSPLNTVKQERTGSNSGDENVGCIDVSDDKSLFNVKSIANKSPALLYARGAPRLRAVINAKNKEPEVFQKRVAAHLLMKHGEMLVKSRRGMLVANKFRQICGINTRDFIDFISSHEYLWGPYTYEVKQLVRHIMQGNECPPSATTLPPLSRVIKQQGNK